MNFRSLLAADWRLAVVCVWPGLAKNAVLLPLLLALAPGVVQHRPRGGFPNQLWLTCVLCQVGRISYKFVIVYRSAIAGGFIKEQNLFIIYLSNTSSLERKFD